MDPAIPSPDAPPAEPQIDDKQLHFSIEQTTNVTTTTTTEVTITNANDTTTSLSDQIANAVAAGEQALNTTQSISVPRLDDLILKTLADHYATYPAFDRIPPEYLPNLIPLLDLSRISFPVAARHITTELFWQYYCAYRRGVMNTTRWQICQLSQHGQSWKRCYIEKYFEDLLESYHPSKEEQNYYRLMKQIDAGKPYVYALTLHSLRSHIDLSDVLQDFPNIGILDLKYGAHRLGMDYDKSLFGMTLQDAVSLSKLLSQTRTIHKLTLTENLLNNDLIHILCTGLQANMTLTYLDVSHNRIGDAGVKRMCEWLSNERCKFLFAIN